MGLLGIWPLCDFPEPPNLTASGALVDDHFSRYSDSAEGLVIEIPSGLQDEAKRP
jgi:hypothetical protein